MKMLRWMHGNTRKDRIRNKTICKKIEAAQIKNKLRAIRLNLDMYNVG